MDYSDKILINETPDKFFELLHSSIIQKLPPGLHHLEHSQRPGKKYTVFQFPEQPNTTYELHFSPSSGHHADYFGEGYHEILALYYKGSANKLNHWLKVIQTYQPLIKNILAHEIAVGLWGKQWAWMAMDLTSDNIERDIQDYSTVLAYFIQATYIPAAIALRMVKTAS